MYVLECAVLVLLFFVKQKTAYEMRISDWSSDVCSADLVQGLLVRVGAHPVLDVLLREVEVLELQLDAGEAAAVGHRDRLPERGVVGEIGRASCWERVCPYV